MPEKLVTVFTPNRQSLSGVVELIRQAIDYRKLSDDIRPLVIYPLPSRIENAENKLQKEWRFGNPEQGIEGYQTQLQSVLADDYGLDECDLTDYFDEYQLQYIPRYSFGEEIAVLSERSEDRLSLARSFRSFSKKLTSDEHPWSVISNLIDQPKTDYEKRKIRPPQVNFRLLVLVILAVIASSSVLSISILSWPRGNAIISSPTSTPTLPSPILGTVVKPSFCYNGPNANYLPSAAIVAGGAEVSVLAKSSDGGAWLMIQGSNIGRCWIESSNLDVPENELENILTMVIGLTVVESACFSNPNAPANIVSIIPVGWRIVILGRSDLTSQWLIVTPHDSTKPCWITSDNLLLSTADLSSIPIDIVLLTPTQTITPTNSVSISPIPLEIDWKLLGYDCTNGRATGAEITLVVTGGVSPYTYSTGLPLYGVPGHFVSVEIMSDTENGEPSGVASFTIPDASDSSYFNCSESGRITPTPKPPTPIPPTPTLCWPPGHCK